ncbi:MAG TPA: hypothetical protein VJA27_01680, partial [Patescibacteria group bacterium]|nr:hypothetical protein [Patescibacteria group bacterium]
KNNLAKGKLLGLVRKVVPPIDNILSRLESASMEAQLRILKTLRGMLQLAKLGAGFADGIQTWGKAFAITLETIIVPILLVIIFLPWLLLYTLIGNAMPGAVLSKAVARVIKKIDELLKPLEEYIKREKMKKTMAARITQLESAIIGGAQQRVRQPPQPTTVSGPPANDNARAISAPRTQPIAMNSPANDNARRQRKVA